jgi:CheY-like chemotaxis protein
MEIMVVHDGAEALDYLYRRGRFEQRLSANPTLVLLDLKMPRVDGIEVLTQVKRDQQLRNIPVVMLTSSREERDVSRSYQMGANAYVVKPVHFPDFVAAIQALSHFWTRTNESPPGDTDAVTQAGAPRASATL